MDIGCCLFQTVQFHTVRPFLRNDFFKKNHSSVFLYDLAQILNIVLPSGIVSIFCVIFKFPHSRLSIFSQFLVSPIIHSTQKIDRQNPSLVVAVSRQKKLGSQLILITEELSEEKSSHQIETRVNRFYPSSTCVYKNENV